METKVVVEKVRRTIERFRLIEKGERVLIAFSGGPDSVALLVILHYLKDLLGIDIAAAHLDHGLRSTSERDRLFCENFCREMGISFFWERKDVRKIAVERGWGLEDAARFARYEFLENLKREKGFQKVALGHTLSDNVETFFIRVIRGGSLEGLKGIPPLRDFWIRPLIEVKREEIMEFLEKEKIPFVVDETNMDTSILRNWVRLKIIPLLRERNPSIEETLKVTLDVLREEWEFVEKSTARYLKKLSYNWDGKRLSLDLKSFRGFPNLIKRRILFKLLYSYFYPGQPNAVGFRHVNEIVKMAMEREGSKKLNLPEGIVAKREYDTLLIEKEVETVKPSSEVMIWSEGIYSFGDFLFSVRIGNFSNIVADGKYCALFAKEKLKFPLILRYKKPGDRILIPGVGRKKLQDFFVDEKVPRWEREKIPLLVDAEDNVLWIVGYRAREDLKPCAGEEAVLIEVRGG